MLEELFPPDRYQIAGVFDNSMIHHFKGAAPSAFDMNRGWGGKQRIMVRILLSSNFFLMISCCLCD